MNTNKLGEYAQAAEALTRWFENQGLRPGESIAVMSMVIGLIAAEVCDRETAHKGIDIAAKAAKAVVDDVFTHEGR